MARENWVEAMNNGWPLDVIFIDFSKAFDKVSHARLLQKLASYGIDHLSLQWIEDFLSDREFSVRVDGTLSSWLNISSGVPQGSVLGPLLFLVFINDLPACFQSPCLVYADDMKIWRVIQSVDDQDTLQGDLDNLTKWANTWLLPVNIQKCAYMHIGHEREVGAYHLDGCLLRHTSSERDLGVIVSRSMKTHENTARVCARAGGVMGAIRRSFGSLSPSTFLTLFKSHVRPRLEYCSAAAYPCSKGEMTKLEQVQRRATKLVQGLNKYSYIDRLSSLKLFSQNFRRLRGDLITVRKILRGDMGPEIQQFFPLRGNCDRRGHPLTLLKQCSRRIPAAFRLSRRIVNLWNSLPKTVVQENSDNLFKWNLDVHLEDIWHQD